MRGFESGLLIGGGLLLSGYLILGAFNQKKSGTGAEIEELRETLKELDAQQADLERQRDLNRFRPLDLSPRPAQTFIPAPLPMPAPKAAPLPPPQPILAQEPTPEPSAALTLLPVVNPSIEEEEEEPIVAAPAEIPQYPVEKLMDAVVLIEGSEGVGTGFFVKHASRTYLYTAAHVLSGNPSLVIKTTTGRIFKKFGELEVAKGLDLVRMRVLERVPGALQLIEAGEVTLQKEIVAIGNSGGGSVLTSSSGIVAGVGDISFEISAEVIQGNSGGPIILKGQNKVLGLVTHGISGQNDIWAEGTRYSDVRRFGARLDKQFQWVKIPLHLFIAEADKLAHFNQVTRLLYALSALQPHPRGMTMSTKINEETTALDIFKENSSMNAVKSLMNMNRHLSSSRVTPDLGVIKKKYISYYSSILTASRDQVRAAESMSPYHLDIARVLMVEREKAQEGVSRRLNALTGR